MHVKRNATVCCKIAHLIFGLVDGKLEGFHLIRCEPPNPALWKSRVREDASHPGICRPDFTAPRFAVRTGKLDAAITAGKSSSARITVAPVKNREGQ
jgi:hypothetical protein